ncbi:MAG: carboxypeptidase-like regulatory domain-containing protein [Flammeovirgaceae bacterium]|nr:carboxypeptidase-like regulatory domain-containing protein [Flammeovirgaceae bacterium]
MKRIYIALIFISTALTTLGQGIGKITGTIKDAESSNPVEFATVALVDPTTSKPVDGTIADAKGKFAIKEIANGNYLVNISFIGTKQ